jgi:muramoyltetrapeptide carboxypeptidase
VAEARRQRAEGVGHPVAVKSHLVIGIVAPSGFVADPATLDRASAYFAARGHRAIVDPAARLREQRFAGSDAERLASLQRMAARDDVDIVMAARGGYGLSRILGEIDYGLLARSNKLIAGHSDCTALLLALWQRTRTPSLAGPTACFDFGGDDVSAFTEAHFWAAIGQPHHSIAVEAAATAQPVCTATGMLWGGNLAMVTHLVGTPFFPDVDGGILFVEDVAEHPYRIERMLLQLHYAGVLDAQAAILIGDVSGYRLQDNDGGYDLAAAIAAIRARTKTPILTGLPYGHVRDKISLPIGGIGHVQSDGRRWTLDMTHPGGPWQRLQ